MCFMSLLVMGVCAEMQGQSCGLDWLEDVQAKEGFPVDEIHNKLDSTIQAGSGWINWREEITIPVVVHIVWKAMEENLSDGRVLGQIDILNRDFNSGNEDLNDVPEAFEPYIAQKGIRFCLAAETPDGQPTPGISRNRTDIELVGTKDDLYGIAPAWDTERYLNIWVANTGEFLTGFSTYPGLASPERQGVVVHPKYFGHNNSIRYNLGRVAVHETGHFFGLDHTWGSDEACETDDGVEDTPLQQHSYKGCPAHPQVTCGSDDMFMNFMDYVDDGCMMMFSQGQMERMLATIEIFRPGLKASVIPCVQIPVKVSEVGFEIFPNPSNGVITIRFEKAVAEVGLVEVYNSVGQEVYEEKAVLFDGMRLELPEIPPGVYWLRIGNSVEELIKR